MNIHGYVIDMEPNFGRITLLSLYLASFLMIIEAGIIVHNIETTHLGIAACKKCVCNQTLLFIHSLIMHHAKQSPCASCNVITFKEIPIPCEYLQVSRGARNVATHSLVDNKMNNSIGSSIIRDKNVNRNYTTVISMGNSTGNNSSLQSIKEKLNFKATHAENSSSLLREEPVLSSNSKVSSDPEDIQLNETETVLTIHKNLTSMKNESREEPAEAKVYDPLMPYPEEYPEEYQTIQNGPAMVITRTTYTRIPNVTYTTIATFTLPTYKRVQKAEDGFGSTLFEERKYKSAPPPQ